MTEKISNIDYTSRDFATIKESLSRYVKATEPNLWTDFFESNLGVLLMDFVAYVGDVSSFAADRISEEVFPETASRRESLLKFCKAIAYSPRGSSPASVRISALGSTLGAKFLTQGLSFNKGTSFVANGVTFELAQDYYFNAGETLLEMDCSSGTTGQEVYTSDGRQYQEYTVAVSDIIDKSWSVFVNGIEWERVDSILLKESERVYEVTYTDKGYITVRFGNGYNGIIPMFGAQIIVNYRSGGGTSGNIGAKTISSRLIGIYDDSTTVSVTFTNDNRASGGLDAETIEHIKKWLPGWIKTNNRAVSVQDYMSLLNTFSDPVYGAPYRSNAKLRISGFGNIIEGIYPESRDIPYVVSVEHEFFGLGKGIIVMAGYNTYSYTTENSPIVPNSVIVSGVLQIGTSGVYDNYWFRDDGNGNIIGDYCIGGAVDYENGIITVTFGGSSVPDAYEPIYVYYEYSPLTDDGANKTDKGFLLGYGAGVFPLYTYSNTLPNIPLVPNQEADSPPTNVMRFGVRLKTVLNDGAGGPDIPIELYDSIDATPGDLVGVFMDATLPPGTPSPNVLSSSINYATGVISVQFNTPVKTYEGVYIYYTDYAYDWSIGTGAQYSFNNYIGERVVPGTIRLHTLVGGVDVMIRDHDLGGGNWELEVINTGSGVTLASSIIDYVAGELTLSFSPFPALPPDNFAPIKIAYRAFAPETELPYASIVFVRALEDITMGGLVNPGMYQWLDDRWHLLMDDTEKEYVLPANVVDVWLWSLDNGGHLAFSSDTLITAVREYLYANSIVTTQLNVVSGELQPFNIDLRTVYYDKKYNANTLRSEIHNALVALTTAEDKYPGESLTLSEIYNSIYSVPGILGFRIFQPTNNIVVNKHEMATFGKVERQNTGLTGVPNVYTLGIGSGGSLVFSGTLPGVGLSNYILNLDNSVKVETYTITPTTIEKSVAYSRIPPAAPPPPADTLGFENTEGTSVDEDITKTYVNYTTGAIRIEYLYAPENLSIVLVTYWTEHFVVSGKLLYTPVIGGTVLIEAGEYVISDDSGGNLIANNVTGTINYDTGEFEIDIENTVDVPPLYDGVAIYATYEYSFKATFTPLIKGSVIDNIGYCPDWTSP